MILSKIIDELKLKTHNNVSTDKEVSGGYTSDLLSDVMGNSTEGEIWITMQTHKNIVAVASLKELPAIIISNGNVPDEDTIEAANDEEIVLLSTENSSFDISGKIYKILKE
ncbi:MAG: serine kinase [Bacteroidales bacterium]|jgi:serine kinase of HPr protein (carbohydrate metabolism regulator)